MTDRAAAVVVSHDSRRDLPSCLEGLLDARIAGDGHRGRQRLGGRLGRRGARVRGDRRLTVYTSGSQHRLCRRLQPGFAELPSGIPYVAFLNPDVVVEPDCCTAVSTARRAEPMSPEWRRA